jgi:uncharacterized membrane protein YhaH (DUF805 family)
MLLSKEAGMQPLDWALLPFSRYFDFSGRSSRAEYWYFTAFIWFVSLVILLAKMLLGEAVESVLAVVDGLFGLATFIPSLAVAVRRLHDVNRSGFVLLKYIVGVIVVLVLMQLAMFLGSFAGGLALLAAAVICLKFLILMAIEGDRGPNPFGPHPYGLTYGY